MSLNTDSGVCASRGDFQSGSPARTLPTSVSMPRIHKWVRVTIRAGHPRHTAEASA
jgi:hypothetical protein